MTDTPLEQAAPKPQMTKMQRWWDSDFMYSFRHAPVAVVSFVVVVLLVMAAVCAPLLAPYDPFNPATLNLMNGFTPPGEANAFTDRKSTRLNSSHLVISYAVFCLKKKTIK